MQDQALLIAPPRGSDMTFLLELRRFLEGGCKKTSAGPALG